MNPLLPLAYDQSRSEESHPPLSTEPKEKHIRDLNASSQFHNRLSKVQPLSCSTTKKRKSESQSSKKNSQQELYSDHSDEFFVDGNAFKEPQFGFGVKRVQSGNSMFSDSSSTYNDHDYGFGFSSGGGAMTGTSLTNNNSNDKFGVHPQQRWYRDDDTSDLASTDALPYSEAGSPPQNVGVPPYKYISSNLNSEVSLLGNEEEEEEEITHGSTVISSSPPLGAAETQHTTIDDDVPYMPLDINSNGGTASSRKANPALLKHIHPLSRNSSNLLRSPKRKRQKKVTLDIVPNLITNVPKEEELAIDRDGNVYGILLDDINLPKGYSPDQYDDPTFFVVKNPENGSRVALDAITNLFDTEPEDGKSVFSLHLENLGLNSLPEQILDFKDLVLYGECGIVKPKLHLSAGNNTIRSISPKVFETERLSLLSLRNNKIARVPGAIEKLTELETFNISNNKIKFLPHNILKLDKLELLLIRPNPLLDYKDVSQCFTISKTKVVGTRFKDESKELRYVGNLYWITKDKQISNPAVHALRLARNLSTLQEIYTNNGDSPTEPPLSIISQSSSLSQRLPNSQVTMTNTVTQSEERLQEPSPEPPKNPTELMSEEQQFAMRKTKWTPKLSELSLRQISKYATSQRELISWKQNTSQRQFKRSLNALINGGNGETCGSCENVVVEPVAELLEWWNWKDSKCVPVKRKFCCKKCAVLWWDEVLGVLE